MGKSKRSDREYSREQKLLKENRMLKRENAKLRKICARNERENFENAKEALEDFNKNNGVNTPDAQLEALKAEWACKQPECQGFLEIILFNKLQVTHYYRKCSSCPHRTQSQKYDAKSVKGIVKNKSEF